MKQTKERPYVLFVAEVIYSEVSKIKNKNPGFSNINAIDKFTSMLFNPLTPIFTTNRA